MHLKVLELKISISNPHKRSKVHQKFSESWNWSFFSHDQNCCLLKISICSSKDTLFSPNFMKVGVFAVNRKKIRKQNLGTLDFDKFRSIEEGGEDLPWMHDWLIKQEKRTLNSRPLVDIKVPHKIVTNFVAAHVVLFNKQYVMIKSSR